MSGISQVTLWGVGTDSTIFEQDKLRASAAKKKETEVVDTPA